MTPRGIVLHTVGVRGDTTMAAIRRFHVAPARKGPACASLGAMCKACGLAHGNGWADAGYHYGAAKDGRIEIGRPLTRVGSHTQGANDTIGIVVYGDGDHEAWTAAQEDAVITLCADLCEVRGWTAEHVHGHREAPARLPGAAPTHKTCPGTLVDMNPVRAAVAAELARRAVPFGPPLPPAGA